MTMAVAKTPKRKRISKKNKVSWRKHVNINDVEEFLEEKRLEERLGPLDVLTNEELFQVDTKPQNEAELLSARQRNRILTPKCFAVLEPHTKVPDPITKRNRVRTKEERKCSIVKKKEEERKLKGIYKAKELQRMKDKLLHKQKLEEKPKVGEFNQDIWSVDDDDNKFGDLGEWIGKEAKRHTLRGIGNLKKVIPKVISEPTPTLSVEPPHPGMSYNPSYEDHQDLLRAIAEKEMQLIKQENHLNRVTKNMFRKIPANEFENSWLVEMSEGLPKADADDNESEAAPKEDAYSTPGTVVVNKKKTAKQRRKQKEQLELEKLKATAKIEKKKRADIHKLRLLNKSIEKTEEKEQILKEQRAQKKLLKAKRTKRLGKLKFEEPTPDFNFSKDIPGNLRNVKCEGNALADRFMSLQKRNVLETTIMQIHKKVKVKKYCKPGFKENWKTTVARSFK